MKNTNSVNDNLDLVWMEKGKLKKVRKVEENRIFLLYCLHFFHKGENSQLGIMFSKNFCLSRFFQSSASRVTWRHIFLKICLHCSLGTWWKIFSLFLEQNLFQFLKVTDALGRDVYTTSWSIFSPTKSDQGPFSPPFTSSFLRASCAFWHFLWP